MVQFLLKRTFPGKPNPLLAFVTVLVLAVVGFYSLHFPYHATSSPEHAFISSASNATIAGYLRALTMRPHLAGTKPASATARHVFDHFAGLGLRAEAVTHAALLSYPVRASLAAHFSGGAVHEFRLGEPERGDTWREGFERGHVMRGGIGDPLSPGWGAVEGGERLGLDDSEVLKRFPKIPSMPLSSEAAESLLLSLGGAPLPFHWRPTLKSSLVSHVGPGPTFLNFTYQGELKMATVENIFAIIKGREESDRYVLLGNHRDAWTYGAVDPNSGTAALLDIARRYSILLRLGWNPRRTIILCSWDAEEFGMIGSTEWVEQNLVNLGSKAVAYLNVDCAVQGQGFFAGSTPQLDDLLLEVIKKVKDPDSEGTTIYDNWVAAGGNSNIQRLGRVDSDFAPFVQHAGIPSIDLYFGKDYPVYHTAFDSYSWMTEFGDPFFQRHVAVTGIWGLLALRLADDSILPFNYLSYADQLQVYHNILSNLLDNRISLDPLTSSIQEFASAAKEANDESKKLRLQETPDSSLDMKMRAFNDKLMLAEKGFLDVDGLRGRQWFKHLVFGPSSDHESKLDFFPGIADSMSAMAKMSEKERLAAIQHEIWRVARAIQRAALALRGELA
ncbi:probable glutamate carboxypeptidase PLA3 [Cajanus cajan]|uniref:probable glutamate carboxypeptidase PLA3 n=1 Tax=Cajanus cajan TaxID=3821 RepID=UPI00098DC957|nr:probable glutamate carboxypeptidase PLA3 [Cajanus cajan]